MTGVGELNNAGMIQATGVFVVTYGILISEKLHRTVVALLGALIVIVAGVVTQEEAISYIDFNTIGLLVGMMVIVGIARETGVFEYAAVKAAVWSQGKQSRLLMALCLMTTAFSGLLDNVTTVLLIAPMTLVLCEKLQVDAFPYLIGEIIASNVGGTGTLIGDPPNIMIGSATHLTFGDFLINLFPITVLIMVVTIGGLLLVFRSQLAKRPSPEKLAEIAMEKTIKDASLLRKCLIVFGLTFVGFLLHATFGLETATIALGGATLLMLVSGEKPNKVLTDIEWPTILFFVGLFILVGALQKVGLVALAGKSMVGLTDGHPFALASILVWGSGIFSGFIDNIPFVATLIPIVHSVSVGAGLSAAITDNLWWSLALGACLGGNLTLIGASANVVVAGIAKSHNIEISFGRYLRYGAVFTLMSLVVSWAYIGLRFVVG